VLKIKPMGRKDASDADIPAKELLNWLKSEIRERDSRANAKTRAMPSVARGAPNHLPHSESTNAIEGETGQDVHVLIAQTKSKKFNRQQVLEQAQASASRLVKGFLEGPIAAIETSDVVMDMIKSTSITDSESWKKVEQTVGTSEKKYVREIYDMLKEWRWNWEAKKGPAHAFVYNFRTGKCIYYDLEA